MYYLYVVRCADDSLYTGITTNLNRRINEHNTSKRAAKYTKAKRPVTLIYSKRFRNRSTASSAEHAMKSLTRKEKIATIYSSKKNHARSHPKTR